MSEPITIKNQSETGDGWQFSVEVGNPPSSKEYSVTVNNNDFQRLTGGNVDPSELVKKSFEFLLARESKESILRQFNIKIISNYFPEYEKEIKKFF